MNLFDTFKQEFKTIFSDAAIVLTILGGVLLYAFLYPQPYIKQSVTALRVSVVDYDKSDLSRKIAFMLDSSAQVDVVRHDTSEEDAKKALLQGKVKGIVIIPHNFKKDLLLHHHPTIAVGSDASYFLIYGGVLEASMGSVLTESVKSKVSELVAKGKPMPVALKEAMPLKLNIINYFNPNNSYTQYVIPAVFVLILQQIILIGLGIVGGGVNEKAYSSYNYNAPVGYVLFSRIMIFFTLFMIHLLFYFGFVFDFFGIIHLANMVDLVGFATLFVLASSALGVFVGSLLPNREMATPLVLMSSLVLVFSAGFVWPLEAVPQPIIYLTELFPSTTAIQGFLKLNQFGASVTDILPNMITLAALTLLYTFAAFGVMRYRSF